MDISFIHTADLHLGKAFSGLNHLPDRIFHLLQDSVYRSLERIIDAAIGHRVDFVLFVGDLFDEPGGSLKAQIRLKKQLEKLVGRGIQAYICHGNHDPFHSETAVSLPDGVYVFEKEEVVNVPFFKQGQAAAMIYGFSYERSEMFSNKGDEYVITGDACYHIAMLHGQANGYGDHHPYAPFSVSELVKKNFDYWALGHVHKRAVLAEHPPVVYPGNIQGMNIKESGPKGCMLVKLAGKNADMSFISTADIVWEEANVSITGLTSIDSLIGELETMKETVRKSGLHTFLRIRLEGHGELHERLQSQDMITDLLEYMQEEEDDREPFVWTVGIDVNTKGNWDRQALIQQPHFIGELLKVIDHYDGREALEPLTNHRVARRFLDPFSHAEIEDMVKKAESLLLTGLFKE